jgi:hypothetical protein
MNSDKDESGQAAQQQKVQEEKPAVKQPLWALTTLEDVASVAFEEPIAGSNTANSQALARLYQAAVRGLPETADNRQRRSVFSMLEGVLSMHPKIDEPYDPYGPMMVMGGRRSAIPSDFRGHIDVLAEFARRATNPILRTRVSDVCWLLDRKRAALGAAAIVGYVDIVDRIARGDLVQRVERGDRSLTHHVRDHIKRALQIGRAIGWEKPETQAARDRAIEFRKKAISNGGFIPLHRFSSLDLEYGLSKPAETSAELERQLASPPADADVHSTVALWRLAATGYHHAKMPDDEARCQLAAAECLAAKAGRSIPAMMAAHFLSDAIAQLSGVPGAKTRRTALRHQLIDVQSGVSEEMSMFSEPMDLRNLAENVRQHMNGRSLKDKLFVVAMLARSPEPSKLATDAREMIQQHPLASLLGTDHLDRDGKVIHRTEASNLEHGSDGPAVQRQIAQAEGIRRTINVGGAIAVGRQMIADEHFISDDILAALLCHSPFVPGDLLNTFSRGFARFFQGDYVSALYILTPLLENSLRYVLKQSGHDVSIFDDATKTQQDRTISSLYEQMRAELDEILGAPITTDIQNVFLSRPGPGIRHSLAHGLLHDGDPYGADALYACWLIFRICLLPLLQIRDKIQLPDA